MRLLRWAYACLALALLAKGFVALVLFGLVMMAFMLAAYRSPRALRGACGKWFEPWALVIFLAIAAPWHVAASLVEPIFAWFYFINEHVLRFLGKREPHDYYAGAWWYYLPRLAIYLFPWSFFLPCLLTRPQETPQPDDARLRRFLWIAWLAPLIFFSVSSAKANYYLVAVMPFAAFHLAIALENRNFLNGIGRAAPGLLIAVLGLLLCVVLITRGGEPRIALTIIGLAPREFLFWKLGGWTLLALAAAIVAWRRPRVGILAYLALPAWITLMLMLVLTALEPTVSTRQTAHYLQAELPGRSVYLYRNFEEQSSLPFYLKKPVQVIDARSNDLFWGNKLRSNNDIMISAEQFGRTMQTQLLAVVVMDRQLKDFKAAHFFGGFKGEKRIGETTVFFN